LKNPGSNSSAGVENVKLGADGESEISRSAANWSVCSLTGTAPPGRDRIDRAQAKREELISQELVGDSLAVGGLEVIVRD